MSVAKILETKGNAVITTDANQTMREAARLLSEYRIGAIIIKGPAETIAGILSERDIVRALATRGADALDDRIAEHMTRKVTTCTPAFKINEVMEVMTAGKFRHLPVIADGRLEGMISIGDAVKHRLAELENESRALRDYIAAS